jgi:protein-S-isoprenylcysteine O-methyltransferase Ste14
MGISPPHPDSCGEPVSVCCGSVSFVWRPRQILCAHLYAGTGGSSSCLALLGLFLRLWGTTTLSMSVMRDKHLNTSRLVTNGLFAATRNPLYLGSLLMLAGFSVHFGWLPACLFIIISWIRYERVIRFEEGKLRDQWGDQFERYLLDVPRWLPTPAGLYRAGLPVISSESLLSNIFFVAFGAGCVVSAFFGSLIWLIIFELAGGFLTAVCFLLLQGRQANTNADTEQRPLPVPITGGDELLRR